MAVLPQHLITDILSLLPVKSLLRFQCVSKPWFALIHDPYFINVYFENNNNNGELSFIVETSELELSSPLRRWKYDYHLVNFSNEDESMSKPLKIIPPFFRPHNLVIGCCNSLVSIVCILNYDDRYSPCNDFEIFIWNPSIKKYKRLPFMPIEPIEDNLLQQSLAFGYDPVNNDYKVLMIVYVLIDYRMKPLEIMIYSLKARSWRRVEDQWPCKDSTIWSGPVFSNGAFHWLIDSTRARTLLAFDLITEKFRVQATPFNSYSIMGLNVLEGLLCVSVNTKDQDIGLQRINVWTMKEYGVASSWSRLYTVRRNFRHSRSLAFSNDGKKVLMQNMSQDLCWYDTNNKTWSIVSKNVWCNIPKYWAMSCVESLFLLDGDSDN